MPMTATDLADSYDSIEALLDDVVGKNPRFDGWEDLGIQYRITGSSIAFGSEFTNRSLKLGYVPSSCTGTELILTPIQPAGGTSPR